MAPPRLTGSPAQAHLGNKKKWRFLQKYWHKGAYFQDASDNAFIPDRADDIFDRDYSGPTGEDKLDKTVLPKVMLSILEHGVPEGCESVPSSRHLPARTAGVSRLESDVSAQNPGYAFVPWAGHWQICCRLVMHTCLACFSALQHGAVQV